MSTTRKNDLHSLPEGMHAITVRMFAIEQAFQFARAVVGAGGPVHAHDTLNSARAIEHYLLGGADLATPEFASLLLSVLENAQPDGACDPDDQARWRADRTSVVGALREALGNEPT